MRHRRAAVGRPQARIVDLRQGGGRSLGSRGRTRQLGNGRGNNSARPDREAELHGGARAGAKAEIQSPSRRTSCILIHGFTKGNIMMRSSWMGALAAMALSASLGPAAAQSGVQVGPAPSGESYRLPPRIASRRKV